MFCKYFLNIIGNSNENGSKLKRVLIFLGFQVIFLEKIRVIVGEILVNVENVT